MLGVLPGAAAQPFTLEPGIRGELTYTNNAGFDAGGAEEPDLIVEMAPSITFRGGGARLRTSGTMEFVGLWYARDTQRNRVLPNGVLTATVEAIERRFFIEASVSAQQDQVDPFGVRPAGFSTVNTQTSVQYRLAPYLRGELSPNVRYLLRSDNTYTATHPSDLTTTSDGYFGRHLLELERLARPLGWRLAFERADRELAAEGSQRETLQIARASLRWQASDQLAVGLRGGYETNNFTFIEYQDDRVVGGEIEWRPTERTLLRGFVEDRFFGTSWNAVFTHRMPWLAWDVATDRSLTTGQEILLTAPAGANVASLLSELLTTRIPDPVQREAAVQDLIRRGRLPAAFGTATTLYTQRVNLVAALRGTVALVGIRNSLALSGFRVRTENLGALGFGPGLGQASSRENNEQKGASLTYSLVVSAVDAVSLGGTWSTTTGLGALAGDQTRQTGANVRWTRRTGPRTGVFAGARYQVLESSVQVDADETAVFAGFTHRF